MTNNNNNQYHNQFDQRSNQNVNYQRRNNNNNTRYRNDVNNHSKRGGFQFNHNNNQYYGNNSNQNYQHNNNQNYHQNFSNNNNRQNESTPTQARKRQRPEDDFQSSSRSTPSIITTAKKAGKTVTDLLIGDLQYFLKSKDNIDKFKARNLKWPKKLNYLKTTKYTITEPKIDMKVYTIRNCIILVREKTLKKSKIDAETEHTTEKLKNSTIKDREPNMSDDDDNLADLLNEQVVEIQAAALSYISGVKQHYKPITTFITIVGSKKFQGAITQVAVENGVVPVFLSPVNYEPFEKFDPSDRPEIFIRRTNHYLKFYHTDRSGKLEDLSDEKCVDCDEI